MNLKERCKNKKAYEKLLDHLAEEISQYDFSDVPIDNTDEACFNLAKDLYNANDEEANEIVNIIMNKYIQNIE